MNKVKVGASSKWANPFKVGRMFPMMDEGMGRLRPITPESEEECFELYRTRLTMHINSGFITLPELHSLRGKQLKCNCGQNAFCHARILEDIVNRPLNQWPWVAVR